MKKRPKQKNTKSEQDPVATIRGLQLNKALDPSLGDLDDVTPIVEFLEMFREISNPRGQLPLKLISLKVPVPLLEAFKFKCQHMSVPYQTMIKRLMQDWLRQHAVPESSAAERGGVE